jgi:hypothetical protein
MVATAANVQISQGSGTRLATASYLEGGVTVHDEKTILGEQYLPLYGVIGPAVAGLSIAVANDHTIEIMAGATLNLYIRHLLVYQVVAATTAAFAQFQILSLTTAGTGGTVLNAPVRIDNSDAVAGATAMSLPTVKGTESRRLWQGSYMMTQTVPTAGGQCLMFDIDFDRLRQKSVLVANGVANGICFKNITAVAGAQISVTAYFNEIAF